MFEVRLGHALAAIVFASALCGCSQRSATPSSSAMAAAAAQLTTTAGLVHLGDDVAKQGDLDGALLLYQAASSRDGRDAVALKRIGAASIALGEPLRAEQAFRAALVLDSDDASAKYGLGVALLALRRVSDAVPILAALGKNSADPRLIRAYGVALDMAGRSAEAQATYRRGLAAAPADANLHGDLALSLAASGDLGPALAESDAAVAAVIPDPRQKANNILLLAMAGQEAEARRRGESLLGADQTKAVLKRAALVRQAPDAAARAAALGLLTQPPPG